MLDAMRKSAGSPALKVLFGIIVLVFVFWGVGSVRENRMEMAARVDDAVITRPQFEQAYRRIAAVYQSRQVTLPAEFVRRQALGQLVDLELLVQEAHRLGLEVDEAELRKSIAAIPDFQNNGTFDKELYLQLLQLNGFKPADFEEMQRRQLLASRLQEIVKSGVHVSDAEIKERFRFENEKRNLRFVRLAAADFLGQAQITDADVEAYFAKRGEAYRTPERVRVDLIEFRAQDFADQVTPSDAEVEAYYQAHLDDYQFPEEVRARHILFRVAPDAAPADKAAARKQGEEVLAKAKGGADFAALAKEYSQDSNAAEGGDLGSFGRGVMTPAFEQAAFALAPGQIGDVVETPFGFHVIKVEGKTPERSEPLEAVRPAIVTTLKTQKGRQEAAARAEAAHERLLDGERLAAVAAAAKLSVQSPPAFARGEPIGGLGMRPELTKEAFNTPAKEVGEIVTDTTGYTVFVAQERILPAVPELAAVRPKVETDLRRERAAAAAKERATALLAKLKEQPDLAKLAAAEHLKVEESDGIGRQGATLPNLGSAAPLKEAAFRLTPAAPVAPDVYDVGGDAVIAVLAAEVPADESRFETEKAALRERLRQSGEADVLQRFLAELKAKAKIEVGEGMPILGQGSTASS